MHEIIIVTKKRARIKGSYFMHMDGRLVCLPAYPIASGGWAQKPAQVIGNTSNELAAGQQSHQQLCLLATRFPGFSQVSTRPQRLPIAASFLPFGTPNYSLYNSPHLSYGVSNTFSRGIRVKDLCYPPTHFVTDGRG